MKKVILFFAVVFIVMAVCLFSTVGRAQADVPIRLIYVDFEPEDGTYKIDWPSPRRKWRESDKEYYDITAFIDVPAPCSLKLGFWIKQNRTLWFDKELGSTTLIIKENTVEGHGRFWLVCTKKGKVKSNENKNGRKAKIYVEAFTEVFQSECDIDLRLSYEQNNHTCRCKKKR